MPTDNSEYNIRFNYTDNSDLLATNTAKVGTSFSLLGGKVSGLALRFVGYNLVLNQIMSAQQELIKFINDSVGAFREFQLRMAEISSIMEDTDIPMLDQLKLGIEALSQAYSKASSDMAKGMYDIISAAFSAEDALGLLTISTRASIAGLSDIRTSVDIFTTVLNAYGKSVEQATNISNILFQSVVRGKFQFEDLESALGYVVPIAAQSGVAFNELMAALSSVTRQGVHLDMASRGLALMIQNIINPTEGATKAADKYGIEMNSLALNALGLHGWFEQINEATHEFGTKILGELIPNMRSLRVAMVLAGDEGLAGFNEDLERLANMGNRTEEALNNIMQTSQFVSSQLTQQFEQVKRDVGASWDEMVLGIQKGVLGFVRLFTGAASEAKVFKNYLAISNDDIGNATKYVESQAKILEYDERRKQILEDIPKEQARELTIDPTDYEKIHEARMNVINWQKEYEELGVEIKGMEANNANLIDSFYTLVGGIVDSLDALGDLELRLDNISLSIEEYENKLVNDKTYGWGEGLKVASVNISDLTTLTTKQSDALSKLGTSFKGTLAYEYLQLKANKDYEDSTHDVNMGLQIANYNYKTIPQNIKDAIDAVRNYTKVQDENRKSNELMSAAMRELQIRTLQIQLAGMSRRRGLTRSEQKELKKIEIEQARMRLENMKAEKNATASDISNYNDKQKIIDDYLLSLKEEQYVLKYNYDQQLADMEYLVGNEAIKLQNRYDWWKSTNEDIATSTDDLIKKLDEMLADPEFVKVFDEAGLSLQKLKDEIIATKNAASGTTTATGINTSYVMNSAEVQRANINNVLKEFGIKPFGVPTYQRGTSYVTETGIAEVHSGEKISPSGYSTKDSSSSIIIQNLNIDVKELADIGSAEKIASLLSVAQNAGMIKNGKTRYRMR